MADEGEASEGPEEDSCLVLSKEEAKERGEFFSPPLSSDDLEGKKKKKDKTQLNSPWTLAPTERDAKQWPSSWTRTVSIRTGP